MQTNLLPPVTAVRIVWALTGEFSDDNHSQFNAKSVEDNLKNIKDFAEQQQGENEVEKIYVRNATVLMDACRRSLDIIHKKRELDFKENDEIRNAYLEDVKENLAFGTRAKNILKSLPIMAITGFGGTITLAEVFNKTNTPATSIGAVQAPVLSSLQLWGIGAGFAAVGYIVNLVIVKLMRSYKQKLFVGQDYERGLYFNQYVNRVKIELITLYWDLNRIHNNIFKQKYPADKDDDAEKVVGEMLKGVQPLFCPYVHKHMQEKKVTPELWPLCEAGKSGEIGPEKPTAVEQCVYWEGKK